MARRVLRQHDLAALAVLHPKIVDVADVAARHDAVAAARPVNLLGDDRHGARVLHQFRREQRHHVERAPQDMAVAAGEQVAGLDRIIHDRELHVEAVFLEEHAAFIRLQAVVGDNDGRPTGPDVDRELDDQLAVLHRLVVIADAADGRDGRAVHERHGFVAREQFVGDVARGGGRRRRLAAGGEVFLHLVGVNGHRLRFAGRRDLVPPAVNAKAHHGEEDDGQNNFATCSHRFLSSRLTCVFHKLPVLRRYFSLTPRFSGVCRRHRIGKPFQRFPPAAENR